MDKKLSPNKNSPDKRLSAGRKIAGGIAAVVLIIVISLLIFLFRPAPPEEVLPVEEKNSEIFSALAAAGLTDAVVDVSAGKVIVDVEVPENSAIDGVAAYALGVIGAAIPDESQVDLVLRQGEQEYRFQGSTTLLHQAQRKEITIEQLLETLSE